jgi:hypothetical protein
MGGHRKLDDFATVPGNYRTLSDKLFVMPVQNGTTVRILAQLNGQQNNYLEYFASDGGGGMMPNVIPSGGRVLDGHKLDMNSSAVLVLSTDMHPPQLVLHKFDDANQSPMPAIVPLTMPGDLGTSGQIEAMFSPAPDGSLALAMSYQPSPTLSRAAFGVYTGNGMLVKILPLFDDPNTDITRPTGLMRFPPTMTNYAFYGEIPQVQYSIRDGVQTVQGTQKRTIPGNARMLMSNIDMAGKLNLVAADLGTNMMMSLKLLVSQVDPSQIFSFDPATFVVAKNAMSLAEVPIGSLQGLADDMLLFAGPTGVTRTELSLWFVDIWGQTRVEQKLANTIGEVSNGAAFPRGNIGGVLNKFHLVWSESMTDANGKYDVLWYDQIECL